MRTWALKIALVQGRLEPFFFFYLLYAAFSASERRPVMTSWMSQFCGTTRRYSLLLHETD